MSVIDDGALTWAYQGYWGTNAGYGPAWLELVQNLNQRCEFVSSEWVPPPPLPPLPTPLAIIPWMQETPYNFHDETGEEPVSPVGLDDRSLRDGVVAIAPNMVRDILAAIQTKLNTLEENDAWCDSDGSAYSGFDLTPLSTDRPNFKVMIERIRQSLDEHRYAKSNNIIPPILPDGWVPSGNDGAYIIIGPVPYWLEDTLELPDLSWIPDGSGVSSGVYHTNEPDIYTPDDRRIDGADCSLDPHEFVLRVGWWTDVCGASLKGGESIFVGYDEPFHHAMYHYGGHGTLSGINTEGKTGCVLIFLHSDDENPLGEVWFPELSNFGEINNAEYAFLIGDEAFDPPDPVSVFGVSKYQACAMLIGVTWPGL